jgi:hypothetical protein
VTIRQPTQKRGFNTGEAAAYLGFSVSWLRKKRCVVSMIRAIPDRGF